LLLFQILSNPEIAISQKRERDEAHRREAELREELDRVCASHAAREAALVAANEKLLSRAEELSATVARLQAQVGDDVVSKCVGVPIYPYLLPSTPSPKSCPSSLSLLPDPLAHLHLLAPCSSIAGDGTHACPKPTTYVLGRWCRRWRVFPLHSEPWRISISNQQFLFCLCSSSLVCLLAETAFS
jgi:hypothetical protein